MFAERGAHVLGADAIGRELMRPGQAVFAEIVARFGQGVVLASGELDRPALARLAFEQGGVEELNGIVHPAVIAQQERLIEEIGERDARAIVVVESALIFETRYAGPRGWRERFDRMVLVTAPESAKIARFVERSCATEAAKVAVEAEARRRMALQMPDEEKIPFCDYVLVNDGDVAGLQVQVERVWRELVAAIPVRV